MTDIDLGNIMALDFGGNVGVAIAPLDLLTHEDGYDASRVDAFQFTLSEAAKEFDMFKDDPEIASVMKILHLIRTRDVRAVVPEDFSLRPGKVLKGGSTALLPLTQEAMLRFALAQKWFQGWYGTQQVSGAKGVVTDARLRRSGLWIVGKKDARDACRHLLLFLRRLRNGEVELPTW